MSHAPRWKRRPDNTMSLMDKDTVLLSISGAGVFEFGSDDEGTDFKLFGATASAFMLWDASLDKLRFDIASLQMGDNDELRFGDLAAGDITIDWDGTNFLTKAAVASSWLVGEDAIFINTTLKGTLTVGKDDIGNDVQFFGATASAHLLWDESADQLKLVGNATIDSTGKITHDDEVVHNSAATQTKSSNYTFVAADSGKITYVDTDAVVLTLPSTVIGYIFTVVNIGADAAVKISIDPATADKIVGNGSAGTDNKDLINTKTTAKTGDRVTVMADGVVGWYITEQNGTWDQEA